MLLVPRLFRRVFGKKDFFESLALSHVLRSLSQYCDSSTAIAYSKDPRYHEKTKHIDIRYHFIGHMIVQKEVILRHIPTSRTVVDPLTKLIAHQAYQVNVRSLRLHKL